LNLSKNKQTIILILIAFTFSFAIRLIWVEQFNGVEQFKFNNQFMINTNDGYLYAEGAREILSGADQGTAAYGIGESASKFTAFIAKLLPFSLETIIFYMPAFFASLIIIPLILIGRNIEKLEVGFIAALVGSIAWSYYNRTMVGYYDTDMLNIVFPTLLLWSLVLAEQTREDKYLLFTALDILAYRWWYPQSYSLEFAFFGLILMYAVYQHIKKQDMTYSLQLTIIMLLAMSQIDMLFRILLVLGYFVFLRQVKLYKYLYLMLSVAFVLFLISGGFDPIWAQLKGYIFKDAILVAGEDLKLNFFSVMQTVREAGQIPFETFADRISGHTVTFILSIIGYIWLVWKHRVMLLGLPMIGLGFLAYSGGLRFTVYAVPVLALGIAFLIVELSSFLKNKKAQYGLMAVLTIAVLIPNIAHVVDYKVPTVLTKDEVLVLDKLKNIASREDYLVGWWDYGYPIRYYANMKTLSDGGNHEGSVNFPTSFALTNLQLEAAKMIRLDVEYTEAAYKMDNNNSDKNRTNIANMTLDYGFKDTNDFLAALKSELKLPNKTRDIYVYLPNRMMDIYPTVTLFSNLDLMTGVQGKQPFFYRTGYFKDSPQTLDLGNGVKLDKQTGTLQIGNNKVPIKNFAKTFYDKSGVLQKQIQTLNPSANLSVVFMSNYNQFLVVDDKVYNSLYFQLFVLENYDKNLFEPTILTPLSKVYKLKV
jgi:undecaprenyl-diphosphooligosaccharide---protein glycotransferase